MKGDGNDQQKHSKYSYKGYRHKKIVMRSRLLSTRVDTSTDSPKKRGIRSERYAVPPSGEPHEPTIGGDLQLLYVLQFDCGHSHLYFSLVLPSYLVLRNVNSIV